MSSTVSWTIIIKAMVFPRFLQVTPLTLQLVLVCSCSGQAESSSNERPSIIKEPDIEGANESSGEAHNNDSNDLAPSLNPEENDAQEMAPNHTSALDIEDSAEGTYDPNSSTIVSVRIMSLNVYGHQTMPQSASDYAELILENKIDIVGIQEGVNDWLISTAMPTDYSRSEALAKALGSCWEQRYQLFINTCSGLSFVSNERFDLTDGPNATRTGELAIVKKSKKDFTFINLHWDHESSATRLAHASETAAVINNHTDKPVIVLGDFNTGCSGAETKAMLDLTSLKLLVNGGIDCIFTQDAPGGGSTVNAAPSDHPAVIAEVQF